MSIARHDFADFFADVNGTHRPYAWQERLLDHLLDHACWPDRLVAPTGAGKTSVVDVHVFANALHAVGMGPRVPRRLAMVVDRRVVVDSHDEHARSIARQLESPRTGTVREVADALRLLTVDGPDARRSPLVTARIRGGSPAPRSWLDAVDSCAVLACTPDMWGSRLLLRGYGSSRTARPRAAGLLAMDAAVVVDEAHLSRQLLMTARRVAALQLGAPERTGVPGLQVVETTATPDPSDDLTEVGVLDGDLGPGDPLTARMTTPKPVTLLPVAEWPVPKAGPVRRAALKTITDRVVALREEVGPTVGCVVDTVALAVDVADDLRTRGLQVELVVGRLRPADLDGLRRSRPGLLDARGNREVDVLVATQTVEVGIDLDLSAMVTELAPGTAIAQRVGRVNRGGTRVAGPVTVVIPGPAGLGDTRTFPYDQEDLVASLEWLTRVAGRPDGMTAWSVRTDSPPTAGRRRLVWSRLEHADSWLLARTSEEQFAEPFLDLWLADDLAADSDVGLVARVLPADEIGALDMVRLTPPEPHEVYPVGIGTAQKILDRLFGEGSDTGDVGADEAGAIRPLLLRAGETRALLGVEDRLRPGDLVVLAPNLLPTTAGVPTDGGPSTSSDVFEPGRPDRGTGRATLRVGSGSLLPAVGEGPAGPVRVFLDAVATDGLDLDGRAGRTVCADALRVALPSLGAQWKPVFERVLKLLARPLAYADLDLSGQGDARRLVIVDRSRAVADDDVRQTWRTEEVEPSLAGHQLAVAARAERLGRVLGLSEELVDVLRVAGAHHDDGKADGRFQRMLRFGSPVDDGGEASLLAKSSRRSLSKDLLARAAGGLPDGWRHEQLSVALAWSPTEPPAERRNLVARLIGTTHGHGRPSFRHGTTGLLGSGDASAGGSAGGWPPTEVAAELFDVGGWEQLIEVTDLAWGVWGTAYLEAVLRAADGAVSSGVVGATDDGTDDVEATGGTHP